MIIETHVHHANAGFCIAETCDINGDVNVCTDIFAVGFEEIVDLTAKNITSARLVSAQTKTSLNACVSFTQLDVSFVDVM